VDDGDKILWAKFIVQASVVSFTSIMRMSLRGGFASEKATGLLSQLLAEAIAVVWAKLHRA
jgi:ketopantoate reductase